MDVQKLIDAMRAAEQAEINADQQERLLKLAQRQIEATEWQARALQDLNGTLQTIRMEGIRLNK